MLIELLGWICTILTLVAYYANSKQWLKQALWIWIIGDVLWITYNVLIDNIPHGTLSAVIIGLNIYGLYNLKKKEQNDGQ